MQKVSAAWKALHKQTMLPPSYAELSYILSDPQNAGRYQPKSTNQAYYSNIMQTLETPQFGVYVSNELNAWQLDGRTSLLLGTDPTGYVSGALSGADAKFRSPVQIDIVFANAFYVPIPGITLTWSAARGEMARDFEVTAYLKNEVTANIRITDNTELSLQHVIFDIPQYDRITIRVYEWCLPQARVRIERIVVGLFNVFGNSDNIQIDHLISADPLGSTIPESSITWKLDNTDERWNPSNPQGMFRYLLDQQEVVVRYGYPVNGTVEWIPAGVFYMSDWNTPQNGFTATFTARDAFEMLQDVYEGDKSGTLYDICERVFLSADLPPPSTGAPRYVLNDMLRNTTVNVKEEFIATEGEMLQLCAHAGSCGLYQDRLGTIRIEPITLGIEYDISAPSKSPRSDLTKLRKISTYPIAATNELNLWQLAGENEVLESFSYPFESAQFSAANGKFPTYPKLVLDLHGEQSYSPNITIVWSETYSEMPTEYRITSYLKGARKGCQTIRGNTDISASILLSSPEFDRLEIEVLEWCLPYRKARVEHISVAPDYEINRFNSFQNSEVAMSKNLKVLNVNNGLLVIQNAENGFTQDVNNPLITDVEHADLIGRRIQTWLNKRNHYSGTFRSDPRLDALDTVVVTNKYASKIIVITSIRYTYNGAFRGVYGGREWQ